MAEGIHKYTVAEGVNLQLGQGGSTSSPPTINGCSKLPWSGVLLSLDLAI